MYPYTLNIDEKKLYSAMKSLIPKVDEVCYNISEKEVDLLNDLLKPFCIDGVPYLFQPVFRKNYNLVLSVCFDALEPTNTWEKIKGVSSKEVKISLSRWEENAAFRMDEKSLILEGEGKTSLIIESSHYVIQDIDLINGLCKSLNEIVEKDDPLSYYNQSFIPGQYMGRFNNLNDISSIAKFINSSTDFPSDIYPMKLGLDFKEILNCNLKAVLLGVRDRHIGVRFGIDTVTVNKNNIYIYVNLLIDAKGQYFIAKHTGCLNIDKRNSAEASVYPVNGYHFSGVYVPNQKPVDFNENGLEFYQIEYYERSKYFQSDRTQHRTMTLDFNAIKKMLKATLIEVGAIKE